MITIKHTYKLKDDREFDTTNRYKGGSTLSHDFSHFGWSETYEHVNATMTISTDQKEFSAKQKDDISWGIKTLTERLGTKFNVSNNIDGTVITLQFSM